MAGKEEVDLAGCVYDVLLVRHVTKEQGTEVDAWSVLYSPELEMTLAKRYEEGTAREETIGYTSIQPLLLR